PAHPRPSRRGPCGRGRLAGAPGFPWGAGRLPLGAGGGGHERDGSGGGRGGSAAGGGGGAGAAGRRGCGRPPPRGGAGDGGAGGAGGASWRVDNRRGLFEGVTEAIGEVGGFSATIGGRRLYLIQAAEKGMAWLRLVARGTAGHGSMLQPDNAVTELAETV